MPSVVCLNQQCCRRISHPMSPHSHLSVGAASVRQRLDHHVGRQREQARSHLSTVIWLREAAVHSATVLRSWREGVQTRRDLPWYRKADQCSLKGGVAQRRGGVLASLRVGVLGILQFLAGQHLPGGGVGGSSIAAPEEQSILFADNRYGQTTEDFKRVLKECNTLLWRLPPKCTDEVQPVDAGYGRLFKVLVGKSLDAWLLNGDNVERWESNKLTASDRRVLITQWVRGGEADRQRHQIPQAPIREDGAGDDGRR